MSQVTPAELALLRTRPQQVDTKLVIYKPPVVFACRVNDVDIAKAEIYINYDTVSSGAYTDVKEGMTMYVGTSAGKADIGRVRVKTTTSVTISVAENGLDWADNLYLTVVNFYELWPKSSLDVRNGTNITHLIDYDVPYANQNQYMGTFLCIGPPGICEAGDSIYWDNSGTVQTEGMAIDYNWSFGGGTPTSGTSSEPGYIQYNTPGYYMTGVTALITGTAVSDNTYRPVIVLGGSVQPYTNWGFESIDGSRDEGGWTAKLWLREENMPEIMDGSLCIIYQDSWYGATRQNIGGNSPNRRKILFVGYIIDNSITYDWRSSRIDFTVSSPTGRMKLLEGLSVSMDNVSGIPAAWQQVKNLNGKKALYYYLRWHTTVLNCCDVRWTIDPDPEIPSWDSEISSIYDIVQKFADTYYLSEVVSDRQSTIWVEKHPKSIHNVTGSYNTILDMDQRDWMGEIDVTEQLYSPVSYLEMHGLGYAGIVSGTVDDYLSAAPYINKRNPFGTADFIQGYVVNNQAENNQIVGDVFAHKNARFSSVDIKLAGWYSLFDIAPEECLTLTTVQQDTVRGIIWNRKPFFMREMSIEADLKNKVLLPAINLYEVTQGSAGATVPIPAPVQPPTYPEFPPITGGWDILPWPWDWPKPWVEPPPGEDNCRGNNFALANGPYGLGFDKSQFEEGDVSNASFPCYIRPSSCRNFTTVLLYGVVYSVALSWDNITVQALDASQNVVATAICVEDHGFPGANTYGVYRFYLANGIEVAGFRITVGTGGSGYTFILGEFQSSGYVDANDGVGATVPGMTVDKYYALQSTGGPWHPYGDARSNHRWQVDVGGGWVAAGGLDDEGGQFYAPVLSGGILAGDSFSPYTRVYFKASSPTAKFRVHDTDWADNTGTLSYYLYKATAIAMQLQGAYIENVCL